MMVQSSKLGISKLRPYARYADTLVYDDGNELEVLKSSNGGTVVTPANKSEYTVLRLNYLPNTPTRDYLESLAGKKLWVVR